MSNPFNLDLSDIRILKSLRQDLRTGVERGVEKLLRLDRLVAAYEDISANATDGRDFLARSLKFLGVRYEVTPEEIARIPKTGPVMICSNHPLGAIEGIVLAHLLSAVRPDVKIMANYLLARIPELREFFIFVDPFGSDDAVKVNANPLRQTMRHLDAGGLLAMFPAGEVASFDWRQRRVVDPPWSDSMARLVRKTECRVLPIYFGGRNSIQFQAAGMIHPRLRTLLLSREMQNKSGTAIDTRIGSVIPYNRLEGFSTPQALTAHLRRRTEMLRLRGAKRPHDAARADKFRRVQEAIIPPVDCSLLECEIAALPPEAMMVGTEEQTVYVARAAQIPHTLREIGRLREVTFRATGEGSGKSLDLDRFDDHYLHLFAWHRPTRRIVGSYRIGLSDEVLAVHGPRGLYTSTLFKYSPKLLRTLNPGLELGRSFVANDFQRAHQSLLLLWRGIFRFIALNPKYKIAFGAVSISNDYHSISQQLMVQFLRMHHRVTGSESLVRPRNPFKARSVRGWTPDAAVRDAKETDDISELVSDLEPDQKGLPVLIRQYLKLGAKVLAINVDPDFADCVDGLIMIDVRRTDIRLLEKYMTKEGSRSFLEFHEGMPS